MSPEVNMSILYSRLENDERINVWHISILFGLLSIYEYSGHGNPISISRRKVMQASHIYSLPTYHKYMKELVHFGYIRYFPSYNHFNGSLVYLNV